MGRYVPLRDKQWQAVAKTFCMALAWHLCLRGFGGSLRHVIWAGDIDMTGVSGMLTHGMAMSPIISQNMSCQKWEGGLLLMPSQLISSSSALSLFLGSNKTHCGLERKALIYALWGDERMSLNVFFIHVASFSFCHAFCSPLWEDRICLCLCVSLILSYKLSCHLYLYIYLYVSNFL